MVVIGSVWDRTVEFISDNLSAVVPIALMGLFVPISLDLSIAPIAGGAGWNERLVIYAIRGLLWIWETFGQFAIVALALDPHGGRDPAVRAALRRLPLAVFFKVVVGVGALLLFAPFFISFSLAGYDFVAAAQGVNQTISPGPAMAFGVIMAFAASALIAWLVTRLAVLDPTILMERRGLGSAARSLRLTKGAALKILGVVILYVIVSRVAVIAAKTVFGSLLEFLIGGDGAVNLATIFTSIIVSVVATVFTVIAAAFTSRLYLALRDARESIVNAR